MVRPTTAGPGSHDEAWLIAAAAALLGVAWGTCWTALTWSGQNPPTNPASIVFALIGGDLTWSTQASWYAGTLAAAALLVVVTGFVLVATLRGRPIAIDRAAAHMATRRDVDPLTYKPTARRARALAPAAPPGAIGLPLGWHLPSKAKVWASLEDMSLLIAGPRTMKSSTYTIPLALAAPGACFVTENKRGVLDHSRGPRAERGQVWVFDPQGVAGEPVTWWWNPLDYVIDESRAEKMAAQIAESTREPGRGDSYFDGEAVNLLHLLLLAAASAGEPITTVYTWLTRPTDTRPARVLADAGYPAHAESLTALAQLNPKQRDGVYGSARNLVGFLRNRQMMAWVTPPAAGHVRRFDPTAYARSTDTLYALSKDGRGSAGPLVGALTLAVFEAAEEHATSCAGGRLPVPLVGLLDEAANVCRFKDLDSKYSHYGSRGILMLTVLQSWDQGEEIWGRHGMEKLWSAANIKVYGGGVSDTRFLQRLSDLVGTYDHRTASSSHGRGGRTTSRSVTERPVLSVAELGALPRGRALVVASGIRPMLIKVRPWFRQDKQTRQRVTRSLTTHEPTPIVPTPHAVNDGQPATPPAPPESTSWNVGPIRR